MYFLLILYVFSDSQGLVQWTLSCSGMANPDPEVFGANGGHYCNINSNETSLNIECFCANDFCNSESFIEQNLLPLKQGSFENQKNLSLNPKKFFCC